MADRYICSVDGQGQGQGQGRGGGGALSFISGVARGVRARANKIDPFSRH